MTHNGRPGDKHTDPKRQNTKMGLRPNVRHSKGSGEHLRFQLLCCADTVFFRLE